MAGKSNNHHHQPSHSSVVAARPRRSPWPLAILAAIFVIVPFFAWYGTWYGRTLNEKDLKEYLKDIERPRHVQHALSQVAERIAKGDENVKKYYPEIVTLAGNSLMEIRRDAAWVMGGDNKSTEFHAALLRLLDDPEPLVRRNAALSLVGFGDSRSRPELRAMLRPYPVYAPVEGTLMTILTEGTPVKAGSLLAQIKDGQDHAHEVRSPLPGKIEKAMVKEGVRTSTGSELFWLAPDSESVLNALIALRHVGQQEDLPDVERYTHGEEGITEEIKQQAALTIEAVKSRLLRS